MTADRPAPAERATNERVELARYTVGAGERVIYGQRVLGVVRLVDHPAERARPPLRDRARAHRHGRA